jgi:2-C-methyl-D-erythritol 4-phosphate cytidylyltransferase
MSFDWTLVVPVPASFAANREVLFTQFGETVSLVHCLRSMLTPGLRSAGAVVAVAGVLYTDVQALLAANGISATVVAVTGEGTREQCLSAALATLDPEVTHILVHDIRRPLASADLADRILDSLRRGSLVVIPALAMVDSIKTVDSSGTVTETVDRASLRSVQFPRGFRREQLTTIIEGVDADDFDELVLARRKGLHVTIIEGDPDAFALDIPRDVGLADAIYTCRLAQQR